MLVLALLAICFNSQAACFPSTQALANSGDSFAAGTFTRRSWAFNRVKGERLRGLDRLTYRVFSADSGLPAAVRSSMRWSLLCAS